MATPSMMRSFQVVASIVTMGCTLHGDATLGRQPSDPLDGVDWANIQIDEQPYEIVLSTIAGTNYIATIVPVLPNELPSWTPRSGTPPPLDPLKALDLASAAVATHLKTGGEWQLQSISLERVSYELWIYLVHWDRPAPEKRDSLRVPVMLSGRAIEPREE